MVKIKNVKSIQLKGTMEGRGLVNFDSNTQKHAIKAFNLKREMGFDMGDKEQDDGSNKQNIFNNIKLGKKSFFKYEKEINVKDEKSKTIEVYGYKNLISSACLRHSTYQNDVEMVNSTIMQNDIILSNYLTSFVGLTRGYMFAGISEAVPSLKRKSCLTLTDAIQSNGAKSVMSIGTTEGERNNTSLFNNETVGDIEYQFKGAIDTKTLQFISTDNFFDRIAMSPDWVTSGRFDKCMELHYGSKAKYKTGNFTNQAKYLTKSICENGILLDNDFTVYLIKELLKRILRINISRSTAYAKMSGLEIKLTENLFSNEKDGWITINTDEDIDNLDFSIFDFYEESTDEEFNEIRRLHEEYVDTKKENKKKAKEAALKSRENKRKKKEETVTE